MLRNAVLTPSNNPLREPVPKGMYGGLDLDFVRRRFRVSGRLVPYQRIISLSAPSPKSVWNSQGQLVEVPAGQPAFDHDPVTGQCLGQRIENEATNYASTTDISDASSVDIYGDVETVADTKFPGGHAYKLTCSADGTRTGFRINSNGGVALGEPDVRTVFVNPGDFEQVELTIYAFEASVTIRFDLVNMTINGLNSSDRVYGEPIVYLGDGWYALTITTPGDRNTYSLFGVRGVPEATAVTGMSLKVALPQVKKGVVSSSPIPVLTAGTAVTRAADIVTIQNVDTAEWFNADAFTLYAEVIPDDVQNLAPAVVLGATAQDRVILFFQNGEAVAQVRGNQGITSISPAPEVNAGDRARFAVSYRPGTAHILFNGVTQTVVNELDETPTDVVFGSLLNGTYRSSLTLSGFRTEKRTSSPLSYRS